MNVSSVRTRLLLLVSEVCTRLWSERVADRSGAASLEALMELKHPDSITFAESHGGGLSEDHLDPSEPAAVTLPTMRTFYMSPFM